MSLQTSGSGLSFFVHCLLIGLVCLWTAESSQAATLYWNAPNGGAGTWDTATQAWSTDPAGLLKTTWNNSNGNDAVFPGAAGFTVGIDEAGVSVRNLTVTNAASPGYAFSAGGGTITFVGTSPTITAPYIAGTGTAFNGILAGSSGLIFSGSGGGGLADIDLNAANTVAGIKEVRGTAQITVGNDAAFGAFAGGASDAVIVREGAQIVTSWNSAANRIINNDMTLYGGGSGTGVLSASNNMTFALNGAITLKTNTVPTVTLKADSGSRYAVTNNVDGSADHTNLTLNLGGSAASTISGNVTLGTGALTKSGAPLILLGSANNWSGGTNITSGTLQIGDGGANGSLPDTAGSVIYVAGTLRFNTRRDLEFDNASLSGSGTITQVGASTITLSTSGFSGTVNTGTGTGNIAVGNAGALRITNATLLGAINTIWTGGGISGTRLEIAPSSNATINATINMQGRSPMSPDRIQPQIVNVSGNNAITSGIVIQGGGTQYYIQSESGSSLALNNTVTGSGTRMLNLQGDGNGEARGIIGSGAAFHLNKRGNGTWTLSAANTYAGNTTIYGGTLALAGSGSIASPLIDIRNGSTLDVSAVTFALSGTQTLSGTGNVTGNVSDAATSKFAPGSAYNVGTLVISGNLNMTGGDSIDYNVSGTEGDRLTVGGTMTFSTGTHTINVIPTGIVTPGLFTVATYPTLAGGFGNLTLATNSRCQFAYPAVGANAITFDITTANASLVWNGTGAQTTWDTATSAWLNGGVSDMYYQADAVTFNNSSNNTTISIGTIVTPVSVTVAGAKSYTLSGTGKISGATGLTVSSTGTTTLATTNDYYGTTSVTAGTLYVTGSVGSYSPVSVTGAGTLRLGNSAYALGQNNSIGGVGAATTINGGTLDLNGFTNNDILGCEVFYVQGQGVDTNADSVGDGAIVNNGAADQLDSLRDLRLTGPTTFGGSKRWDLRNDNSTPLNSANPVVLAGNNYALTKTGINQIMLVNLGYTNLSSVVINQGDLGIQSNIATQYGTVLGSSTTPAPITINAGGQFSMSGNFNSFSNNVTLNGGGIGTTLGDSGAQTFACLINMTAGGNLLTIAPSGANVTTATFTGAISGTGDLTKPATVTVTGVVSQNTGAAILSGTAANTYNGATNVYAGMLILQKPAGVNAIPGNLNIGDSANGNDSVNLGASNQIADSSIVTMNGSNGNNAFLNLMGYNETVGGINDPTGYGVVQLASDSAINTDSTLTVNTTAADSSFAGILRDKFQGTGAGKLNLVKDGSKTLTISGTISYTGNTTVLDGILNVVAINTPDANVSVEGGALNAQSIVCNILTIGAGGSFAGRESLSTVPEPSTWAMLMLAATGLGIYYCRAR
jgi:fibronectin-binding autotransporter adhesin